MWSPGLSQSQPTVQVAGLWSLLYPDSLQDSSLQLVCLCLHCVPIRLVSHVPCMYCNAILSVVGLNCILVLRDSLLQGPSSFTDICCFAILAGEPIDDFLPLQFKHHHFHSHQELSQDLKTVLTPIFLQAICISLITLPNRDLGRNRLRGIVVVLSASDVDVDSLLPWLTSFPHMSSTFQPHCIYLFVCKVHFCHC